MVGRRHGGNGRKGDGGIRRAVPDTLEERIGKGTDSRTTAYIHILKQISPCPYRPGGPPGIKRPAA
jgi:hypothetical protein